ncbi:hypothetical protein [Halomonas litopenaei]|uniref:hypothetical protein n=1 Tax=Halomonas litopenaei TaxID=2109328 RepID=UPI003F9EC29D
MPDPVIAVLTGDLIASRQRDREALYRCLDDTLGALAKRHDGDFHRFRGDGFQLAIRQGERGLEAAVALRASLIGQSPAHERWDARIAVAQGPAGWAPGAPLADADDPPFMASGQVLDELSAHDAHLGFDHPETTAEALLIRYLDEMIDAWSAPSAQVVALSLAEPELTQAEMAGRLGIRQPSVHKRLKTARWALLSDTLACLASATQERT